MEKEKTKMQWRRGCGSYWTGPALRWAETEAATYAITDTDGAGPGAALWVYSVELGRWSGCSVSHYKTIAGAMSSAVALESRGGEAIKNAVINWEL
jgi:hypothetical protein